MYRNFTLKHCIKPETGNYIDTPKPKKWIKKIWYIYTIKYYSPGKNMDMIFNSKLMELENITLCEVTESQKEKGGM